MRVCIELQNTYETRVVRVEVEDLYQAQLLAMMSEIIFKENCVGIWERNADNSITRIVSSYPDENTALDEFMPKKEDLERLGERFFRGATPETRKGTGLGVSICRQIAEMHGGSLTVTSQEGEGSEVTITIPTGRDSS